MQGIVFETALGFTSVIERDAEVVALSFGHASAQAARQAVGRRAAKYCAETIQFSTMATDAHPLAERIGRFAQGEPVDFHDVRILLENKTLFQRRVLMACRKIPFGATRTYGQLARAVGSPRAARAVGSVMAGNAVPLVVPCHRVLPAGPGCGGFSAPQGVSMKRRLLELERGALLGAY